MPASRAFLMVGTMALVSDGRDQDALGAVGDAGFNGGHLAFIVAVILAGVSLEVNAEFCRPWRSHLPSS